MYYYVLVFLSFLQSVIGFTLMSSSVMKFKEPAKRRITIGFSAMLFGIILLSYILYNQGIDFVNRIAILFILIIEVSWFLICSKDRFFVSLFNFLTFVNIYVSISYISDTLSLGFSGNSFIIARIVVRTIIYIVILPLLFKFVRPRFRVLVKTLNKEWRAAVLAPLLFLIMQIIILYYPSPYWTWNSGNWYRFVIVTVYLLFLTVYFLLHIQANALLEKYATEKRRLLMTQQEKLWESELIRQKSEADFSKRQRHDMHHHNTVITGLIKSGDIESLKSYMKNFDNATESDYIEKYSYNPIINSILNFYATKANENNIKATFNISVPESVGIDNIDLTCVLGNALENAIEGCLRLSENEEREMIVTVKYFDYRLRVKIENTCRTDIIFEGELPLTQKQGGGMGTKSILYTAERYDGTAGFSIADGKFITQIVLNTL